MGWAAEHIAKLKAGETVSFRLRDGAMKGRIEPGQLCTIERVVDAAKLKVGDIVLCTVEGKEYLRLIKEIQGERFQIGNNRGFINGWIRPEEIHGHCVKVTWGHGAFDMMYKPLMAWGEPPVPMPRSNRLRPVILAFRYGWPFLFAQVMAIGMIQSNHESYFSMRNMFVMFFIWGFFSLLNFARMYGAAIQLQHDGIARIGMANGFERFSSSPDRRQPGFWPFEQMTDVAITPRDHLHAIEITLKDGRRVEFMIHQTIDVEDVRKILEENIDRRRM